jgi:putative spermidine/putrescine transport system substrate-binding protein
MLRNFILAAAAAVIGFSPAKADQLLTAKWDEIIEKAKAEGEVTWYVWHAQPEFRQHAKAFEEQYGIKVRIPDVSSANDGQKKLLAEVGRETGDIDVLALGGDAANALDVAKVFYGPILPTLPQKTDLSDSLNGVSRKGYAVAYWGNQTGMAYDSRRTDPTKIPQTLEELGSWIEKNPGQLGFNYQSGGSGPSLIQNVARNVLGITPDGKDSGSPDLAPVWDWFNKRKDNFVITASNVDSLTRLNGGEFLLVPAFEDHLFSLVKKNEIGGHIKLYVPRWGMNGGGNEIAIPANAPHKAAALLFVSWLTSAKVQTELTQKFGTAPTNKKADASKALITPAERQYARSWNFVPARDEVIQGFTKNVIKN